MPAAGTPRSQFVRQRLDQFGAVPIDQLDQVADRTRVLVGGAVTHRQRPATASGLTFMNPLSLRVQSTSRDFR